jgi:hypothetical protein
LLEDTAPWLVEVDGEIHASPGRAVERPYNEIPFPYERGGYW